MADHTRLRDAFVALKGGYESESDPLTMYDDGIMSESAEYVSSAYDEAIALIDGDTAARRLFTELAPQCTLQEKPAHVINQIDNYVAGLRGAHADLVAALRRAIPFLEVESGGNEIWPPLAQARSALAQID